MQTTMTSNKGDIGHYRYEEPHLTLKEGPKSFLKPAKDSGHMIFYRLSSHPKPLQPIIREI